MNGVVDLEMSQDAEKPFSAASTFLRRGVQMLYTKLWTSRRLSGLHDDLSHVPCQEVARGCPEVLAATPVFPLG